MNELQGAPASTLILAAFVVASLVALRLAPSLIERGVFSPHALLPQRQWHTLVTSAFLHADLPHLFFNGFTFWAFAFGLERRIGTPAFLALYLVGLLASDLQTWLSHRHDPGYRTLGASGAISAVLFASIVYFPSNAIYIMPIPAPIPAPLFAVLYLGFTWYASRQKGGRINHDAHLGGALAGLAFVALTDFAQVQRTLQSLG